MSNLFPDVNLPVSSCDTLPAITAVSVIPIVFCLFCNSNGNANVVNVNNPQNPQNPLGRRKRSLQQPVKPLSSPTLIRSLERNSSKFHFFAAEKEVVFKIGNEALLQPTYRTLSRKRRQVQAAGCSTACAVAVPVSIGVGLLSGVRYINSCTGQDPPTTPPPVTPLFVPDFPSNFPEQNIELNIPVPVIDNLPIDAPNIPDDGCPRDKVNVNGNCESLLTQGSCAPGEWRLLNDANTPQCFPRPCDPGYIFVPSDQLCHDPYDPVVCPGDKRLYLTAYGDPVCACPYGYIPGDNDFCSLAYSSQSTCASGEALQFSGNNDSTLFNCAPNSCQQQPQVVSSMLPGYFSRTSYDERSYSKNHLHPRPQPRTIRSPKSYDNSIVHHHDTHPKFDPYSLNIDAILGKDKDSFGVFAFVEIDGICYEFGNFKQGPCYGSMVLALDLDTGDFVCATLEELGYVEDDFQFSDTFGVNDFSKYQVFLKQTYLKRRQGIAGGISTTSNNLVPCTGIRRNAKCLPLIIPVTRAGRNLRPIRRQTRAPKSPNLRCRGNNSFLNGRGQDCLSRDQLVQQCPPGFLRVRECRPQANIFG